MEAEKGVAMKDPISETVPRLFNEAATLHRTKVALRIKKLGLWHDITWQEYHETARMVGCGLVAMGLDQGDAACIIGDNSMEWVTADLGIQCVGGGVCGYLRHQCLAAGGIHRRSL